MLFSASLVIRWLKQILKNVLCYFYGNVTNGVEVDLGLVIIVIAVFYLIKHLLLLEVYHLRSFQVKDEHA